MTAKGCWKGGWAVTANEFLLGLMKLLELDGDDSCTILLILKNKTKPSELKKISEGGTSPVQTLETAGCMESPSIHKPHHFPSVALLCFGWVVPHLERPPLTGWGIGVGRGAVRFLQPQAYTSSLLCALPQAQRRVLLTLQRSFQGLTVPVALFPESDIVAGSRIC